MDGLKENGQVTDINDLSVDRLGEEIKSLNGRLVVNNDLIGREIRVPLANIVRYPDQPRFTFPEKDLKTLAKDIQANGQQMPMVCALFQTESNLQLILVDGERRYRALKSIRSEEAFVVVHPYLTEAELYEAAAATHRETQGLTSLERILMMARLYELACQNEPGLLVTEFVKREGLQVNDVHFGLRVKKLPLDFLEMAKKGIIAYSGLIYLMNRLQEAEKRGTEFPEEHLLRILNATLRDKRGNREKLYFSQKEIEAIYARALISGGRGDEAVQVRVRDALSALLSSLRTAQGKGEKLDEEVEGWSDPVLLTLLEEQTPSYLVDLTKTVSDVSKVVEGIRSALKKIKKA